MKMKKYILPLIAGYVVFYIVGLPIFKITGNTALGIAIGIIVGAIVIYLVYQKTSKDESIQKSLADVVSYIKSINTLADEIDPQLYAIAEEEVDNGKMDKGLWSQALIHAKGDESLRKVEYMKLRAKQLQMG